MQLDQGSAVVPEARSGARGLEPQLVQALGSESSNSPGIGGFSEVMMRVVVLGAGRIGNAIVRDLATHEGWKVTAVDATDEALGRLQGLERVVTVQADLGSVDEIRRVVNGHDLCIGAVPGPIGFATARTVIEAGIDMVDISFFEQDPFELDALAREHGVVAVVDCGIAPGWSNLAAGYLESAFDRLDRFVCYVGGLPSLRRWPYEYRAVFSPIDVIAEYTRPARMVIHGREVTRSALSDVELLDLPGVGTLEAFNSDGLRTLLHTINAPLMKEKTMRYPGHAERMRMLRETGFFGEEPIDVEGHDVRPIDLTARLLFPAWQLGEQEEDLTVMRVEAQGELDGRPHLRRFDLLDRFDRAGRITSMARTTGYTCTAVVNALAEGMYTEPGIVPPEYLGRVEGFFDAVNRYLADRGVCFEVHDVVDP